MQRVFAVICINSAGISLCVIGQPCNELVSASRAKRHRWQGSAGGVDGRVFWVGGVPRAHAVLLFR
jgi:hypothetical protein